eukprot:1714852-Alexandrium_andersonii.AAC.1
MRPRRTPSARPAVPAGAGARTRSARNRRLRPRSCARPTGRRPARRSSCAATRWRGWPSLTR